MFPSAVPSEESESLTRRQEISPSHQTYSSIPMVEIPIEDEGGSGPASPRPIWDRKGVLKSGFLLFVAGALIVGALVMHQMALNAHDRNGSGGDGGITSTTKKGGGGVQDHHDADSSGTTTSSEIPSPPAPKSPPKKKKKPRYQPSPREKDFGKLVFLEEFDGPTLDESVWNIERTLGGGGNWEFQYYCDDPRVLYQKDGSLVIMPGFFKDLGMIETEAGLYDAEKVMFGDCQPWPECATFHVPNCTNKMWLGCKRIGNDPEGNWLNPITSARINTKGKFAFRYGRIEFRAQVPKGDYLWPALWLLPEDEVYGGWPASGEIDIMESRGNKPGYVVGEDSAGYNAFGSTLHYGNIETDSNGGSILLDGWHNAHQVVEEPDRGTFADGYHIFGFVWNETSMYTYTVDKKGREVVVLDLRSGFHDGFWKPPLGGEGDPIWFDNPYKNAALNAPFDQDFFVIINLAVGGQEGNLGYWSNAPWAGCHQDDEPKCFTQGSFWQHRQNTWLPTWEAAGSQRALRLDYVRVWQKGESGERVRGGKTLPMDDDDGTEEMVVVSSGSGR